MINRNRIVETFIELSRIDGIHGDEREISKLLIEKLKKLNCSVKTDDAHTTFGGNTGNIIARLKGNVNKKSMFLCAHMDTIKSTAKLKHVIKDGLIETDKSTILGGDDRAGISVILEVIEVIRENSIEHGPIEVVFTVCEEAGMHGAKFINKEALQSKMGFVFDCQASPGNYIVEAPGAVSFKAKFIGQSAHAAVSPEKGINAIFIASEAISKLKLGRIDKTGMMNIGTIAGGEAINVVPDTVIVTGETRNADTDSLNNQIENIRSTFKNVADKYSGEVEINFTSKYGGYKFKGNESLIEIAKRAIEKTNIKPTPIEYPGGSDANVFNSNDIPALNLGVGFNNAHSFEERIKIDDLVKTAEIALNIILD